MIAAGGSEVSQDVRVQLSLVGNPNNGRVAGDITKQMSILRKAAETPIKIGGDGGSLLGDLKGQAEKATNGAAEAIRNGAGRIKAHVSAMNMDLLSVNKMASKQMIADMGEVTRRQKEELDKQTADAKRAASDRIAAEKEADKEAGRQAAAGRRAEMASMRQQMLVNRSEHAMMGIAMSSGSAVRSLMMLSQGNKPLEEMAQNLIKIQATFDLFRSGADVLVNINRELLNMRRMAYYARIEQQALGAATASTGAMGAAGTASAGGLGAAGASAGAMGGLGTSAAIAGGGIAIASAGVALHELVALATGSATLAGTLREWTNSVRENVRLEERYRVILEGREALMQEQSKQSGWTQQYYEGKSHIEQAERGRMDVHALRNDAINARLRLMAVNRVGGHDSAGAIALDRRGVTDLDQTFATGNLRQRSSQLGDAWLKAAKAASDTEARNRAHPTKRAFVMPGANQEGNDKLQEQHPIESGAAGGVNRFLDATIGRLAAMWVGPRGKEGLQRVVEKRSADRLAPMQPQETFVKADLTEQLSQQEHALAVTKEKYQVDTQIAQTLREQAQTAAQQVLAAREQVVAAKERVKAEKAAADARNAHFATLTHGEQKALADSLGHIKAGKAKREDFLIAQHFGANSGALGRTVNAGIAKTIDPRLGGLVQDMGGNEDLDKAQSDLTDKTSALKDAQDQAASVMDQFQDALDSLAYFGEQIISIQKKVETTKSQTGGYQDPSAPSSVQGGQPAGFAAVQHAGDVNVAAINELGNAAVKQFERMAAANKAQAQRIKAMHA